MQIVGRNIAIGLDRNPVSFRVLNRPLSSVIANMGNCGSLVAIIRPAAIGRQTIIARQILCLPILYVIAAIIIGTGCGHQFADSHTLFTVDLLRRNGLTCLSVAAGNLQTGDEVYNIFLSAGSGILGNHVDGVAGIAHGDIGGAKSNAGKGHGGGVYRGSSGHGVGVAEGVGGGAAPAILCIAERAIAERPSSSISAVCSCTQRTIPIPQIIIAVHEGVAVAAGSCGPPGGGANVVDPSGVGT